MSMTCLHSYIPIYSNLILFNDLKYMYHVSADWCTSHEHKTGNDVSKFMHSNWITLSYHSSPKHKSLIPKYSIHLELSLLYTVI